MLLLHRMRLSLLLELQSLILLVNNLHNRNCCYLSTHSIVDYNFCASYKSQ